MAALEAIDVSRRIGTDERARKQLVLVAASLGTVFEWYDFFLYGSLAVFFSALFFPPGNETAAFLASLATFGPASPCGPSERSCSARWVTASVASAASCSRW